jgi:hypothetical protein
MNLAAVKLEFEQTHWKQWKFQQHEIFENPSRRPYSQCIDYASANSLLFATCGNGRIFGCFAFLACHNSYCICILSQKSGEVPSAAESLSDMAAETPARPFRMRDRCARVTPSRLAASATVISPK